jgi:hypothetical protein
MFFFACMAITTSHAFNPVHVEALFSLSRCVSHLVEEGRSDAIHGPHRRDNPLCILHYCPVQRQRNHYTYHSNTITPPQHQNTRHWHTSTSPSHRTNFTCDNQHQTRSATRKPTPHHLRLIITRPEVLQTRLRYPHP